MAGPSTNGERFFRNRTGLTPEGRSGRRRYGPFYVFPTVYPGYDYPPYYDGEPWPYQEELEITESTAEYLVDPAVEPAPEPVGTSRVYEVRPSDAGTTEQASQIIVEEWIPPSDVVDPPPAPREPRLHLIALTSGVIYPAVEFWMEDGTLHYVTNRGVHNMATLDQIDMDLTVRLNDERGLPFIIEVRPPRG